jgi:hypothetical protein
MPAVLVVPPKGELERLLRGAAVHGHIDHITADDVGHALAVRRDVEAASGYGPSKLMTCWIPLGRFV